MSNIPIAEIGVGVASISGMVMLVRVFLAHLKDKDEKFTKTINNHMSHSTKAMTKLTSAIDRLTKK